MPKIIQNGVVYAGEARILKNPLSISLKANKWQTVTLGNETYYKQEVVAIGVRPTKKPYGFYNAIIPTTEQGLILERQRIEGYGMIHEIIPGNDSVTVYCFNDCPQVDVNISLVNVGA